jgi:hypothetical protein
MENQELRRRVEMLSHELSQKEGEYHRKNKWLVDELARIKGSLMEMNE